MADQFLISVRNAEIEIDTTTTTPTFLSWGHFDFGDVLTVRSVNQVRPCCREDYRTELPETWKYM